MRFVINPFTTLMDAVGTTGGSGGTPIETITGNSGGAVGPNVTTANINLLGDNTSGINVVGSPGSNTLTISGLASSTTQIGTTRYATNDEASAQTSPSCSLTPSNIASFFSTTPLAVSQGGIGKNSTTPCAPQCGGVTSTSNLRSASTGLSTPGLPFISNGSSTLPSFQQLSASNVLGSTSGVAPAAGVIGEQIRSAVGIGSVPIPAATPTNVTSISLTAGIWDVSGIVGYNNASGTGSFTVCSVGTTSATIGTYGDNATNGTAPSAATPGFATVPSYRLTLNSTTTVYLVAYLGVLSTGSISCGGRISATRVG